LLLCDSLAQTHLRLVAIIVKGAFKKGLDVVACLARVDVSIWIGGAEATFSQSGIRVEAIVVIIGVGEIDGF
jgi:hypothetical protein